MIHLGSVRTAAGRAVVATDPASANPITTMAALPFSLGLDGEGRMEVQIAG
jgi:hypothetical protein